MKLAEAMTSMKPFKRKRSSDWSQWYLGGTGPHKDLVDCDYFVHGGLFSTSIDLYAEDILTDDWEVLETIDFSWSI
jgi:hypothetical protein